jgi:hypothetical protein
MTHSKYILTAHAIRPILPELLDPETALEIDRQLQSLLTQAEAGASIDNQIIETLREHEKTQTWMGRYLKGEAPEEIWRSIVGLAGNMGAQPRKPEYQCPECNTTKAELPQGRIPKCDNHPNETLQRISA